MKKAAGILVMAMTVMMIGGCSKSEGKIDLGKETEKIEIQVPTLEPTPTVSAMQTEEPVATDQVLATPAASNTAEEKGEESKKVEVKMEDYFAISLPEGANIRYKQDDFTASIEKQGKKIADIRLISEYPAKVDVQRVVNEQLEEEGYLKEVLTYEKDTYKMVKARVSMGITKEDMEHGKLIGGGEEAHYIYYRNTTPTSLMILSFKENSLDEAEQDRIAKSVMLNK